MLWIERSLKTNKISKHSAYIAYVSNVRGFPSNRKSNFNSDYFDGMRRINGIQLVLVWRYQKVLTHAGQITFAHKIRYGVFSFFYSFRSGISILHVFQSHWLSPMTILIYGAQSKYCQPWNVTTTWELNTLNQSNAIFWNLMFQFVQEETILKLQEPLSLQSFRFTEFRVRLGTEFDCATIDW